MMHISFGHTTPALVTGNKTVTRRFWAFSHSAKFHVGDEVIADDKGTRNGGREVAHIRLTGIPVQEPLRVLRTTGGGSFIYGLREFENEGFAWLESRGLTVFGLRPLNLWHNWLSGQERRIPYVVRFELLSLTPYGEELRARWTA